MGMKALVLPALLAAVLLAPARVPAQTALDEAKGAAKNPATYDGAKPRPGSDAVSGSYHYDDGPGDRRHRRMERNERHDRDHVRPVPSDIDREPVKGENWFKSGHIIGAVGGLLVGGLIGSIWGLPGLLIGAAVGGLIGYLVARFKS